MKRVFAMVLVCAMMLCVVPFPVQGAQTETTVEYLEDGSYIVTVIEERAGRMMTKVGSRTSTYYSADDELQWKMSVAGEFQYDGTTCICTYATGDVTIYNPGIWYFISDDSRCNQNMAIYSVTFGMKALGITVERPTCSVRLTCDPNGNLS